MSKYIDAVRLRAFKESLADIIVSAQGLPTYEACKERAEAETDVLLATLSPLQQEQPKLTGYNNALLEVKSKVDKLYDEASIGLNEYDCGLYNGIAETCMKLRGFIKARLDSDEQPEVDLEEEIRRTYRDGSIGDTSDMDHNDYENIARHFYELGRNARKK